MKVIEKMNAYIIWEIIDGNTPFTSLLCGIIYANIFRKTSSVKIMYMIEIKIISSIICLVLTQKLGFTSSSIVDKYLFIYINKHTNYLGTRTKIIPYFPMLFIKLSPITLNIMF